VPSLKQYRKLKRVMASITGFYENGTKKKLANYQTMADNLARLDQDVRAARAQLAALEARSEFAGHPKVLQYREFIEGELEVFEKVCWLYESVRAAVLTTDCRRRSRWKARRQSSLSCTSGVE
jgi:hypothetical protein